MESQVQQKKGIKGVIKSIFSFKKSNDTVLGTQNSFIRPLSPTTDSKARMEILDFKDSF
jgi:hypothetical protein